MVVVIVIGEGGRGEKKGFDGRDRMDKRVKEGEGGGVERWGGRWRDKNRGKSNTCVFVINGA